MPVWFKIKVTKEILELSKECGAHNDFDTIGKNCASAIALKDIFPEVVVTDYYIYPFGIDNKNKLDDLRIVMPKIAQDFVKVFDSLSAIHKLRLLLPEFEFEISIPDEIISQINIDEVRTSACLTGAEM
ncbi:MAG TPA: hypothetical protein VF301_01340 [Ginsengibacter sp.]